MAGPNAIALSGTDTLIINSVIQSGLADGDFANTEFPEGIANMKISKDGNVLVALNQKGRGAESTFRFIMGSTDDKTMNSIVANFLSNPSGFVLMTGRFVKKIGDGSGNPISVNYVFSSGVPSVIPPVKGNSDGEPDQGVVVYKIKWGKAARIIT